MGGLVVIMRQGSFTLIGQPFTGIYTPWINKNRRRNDAPSPATRSTSGLSRRCPWFPAKGKRSSSGVFMADSATVLFKCQLLRVSRHKSYSVGLKYHLVLFMQNDSAPETVHPKERMSRNYLLLARIRQTPKNSENIMAIAIPESGTSSGRLSHPGGGGGITSGRFCA